jgi:hypothetical protein
MNLPQLQSTPVEIGGATYQIGLLSFEQARPAYVKLQRILQANEEILEQAGIGLFMFSSMSNVLDDDDLKFYIDLFGSVTTVALGAQQTLFLKNKDARDLLFAGRIEIMFEWLDAATDVNFKSAREKLTAARKRVNAHIAAKVQAEAATKTK